MINYDGYRVRRCLVHVDDDYYGDRFVRWLVVDRKGRVLCECGTWREAKSYARKLAYEAKHGSRFALAASLSDGR